jgi:hypothetical protein
LSLWLALRDAQQFGVPGRARRERASFDSAKTLQ